MKRVTYSTEDGGAIHEYLNDNMITTMRLDESVEVEEIIPDGINIHITGTDISRISNIEIYFKEDE